MICFEKVTFEQFKKDYLKLIGECNDEELRKVYDNIKLPQRSTAKSAGYDFFSTADFVLHGNKNVVLPTGIRAIMPEGTVLMIYPRSSMGIKHGVVLSNGTGIIDADYADADNEGHIMMALVNFSARDYDIKCGDKVAQGIFVPYYNSENGNVDTQRTGGIGSTGR